MFAVKEIEESFAQREYELLFDLRRLGAPCVEPVGVIAGRVDADGEDLPAALITRHLSFSLPYRALVKPTLSLDTWERLLDALVLLIVRLHLLGFAWNDCSLSNTLFLRDAGAFSAHLVDAETGEMHETLSRGQRAYDIETASMNVMGELMDLQAGGMVPETLDPAEVGPDFRRRYEHLWMTLTDAVTVSASDRYQIHTLLRTLNGLGFDVAELSADSTDGGSSIRVQPKVVDAGHHRRRMLRLTGLEMHENQARRLLNDIDSYRYVAGLDHDEHAAARRWVTDVYDASCAGSPTSCAASSRARSWSTRCWPTAGSPRSARARTWASRRPPTTTSQRSCAASPTRQPSSAHRWTTRTQPTTWMPQRCERPPPGTAAHPTCTGLTRTTSAPARRRRPRGAPRRTARPTRARRARAPGMTRLTNRSGGRTDSPPRPSVSARFSTTRSG